MKKANINFKVLFTISILLVFTLALALNASAEGTDALDCNMTFELPIEVDDIINFTYNSSDSMNNVSVYLFGSSSSTANSSTSFIANISNGSATTPGGSLYINFSFPDLGELSLEDGSDWTLDFICTMNQSGVGDDFVEGTANTSVVINRTFPQAPTSQSPTDKQTANDLTFTADVTGENTTACTLYFTSTLNPGQVSYTMTHAGDTCTRTVTSIPADTYSFLIEAIDGTDSINASSSSTFRIETGGGQSGGSGSSISDKAKTIGQDIKDAAISDRRGIVKRVTETFNNFVQNIVDTIRRVFGD